MFSIPFWIYSLNALLFTIRAQTIPDSPCPQVFSYLSNEEGIVYGEATIPYDGSNHLAFSVNVSFKGLFQGRVSPILR